ncbi:MAG: histidine kinase [Rhizobacter sp.]
MTAPPVARESTHELLVEDETADESPQANLSPSRWMGWRMRILVLVALLGCFALFVTLRWLAASPALPGLWKPSTTGQLLLIGANNSSDLQPYVGQTLQGLKAPGDNPLLTVAPLLRSARWTPSESAREQATAQAQSLNALLAQPTVELVFDHGDVVQVMPQARGLLSLPSVLWLLSAMALLLYLVAAVLCLAQPNRGNALYALMAACQAINLVFAGVASQPPLDLPRMWLALQVPLPLVLDLLTAAAMVHASCVHPKRLPTARAWVTGAWLIAASLGALIVRDGHAVSWWSVHSALVLAAAVSMWVQRSSYRLLAHPYTLVTQRFTLAGLLGLLTLIGLAAAGEGLAALQTKLIPTAAVVWGVFFSCLLLVMPFVARSQQMLREFMLLAGVSSIATLLDLGFVSLLSLSQFTSLTLALFLSLAVYAGTRQWLIDRVRGQRLHTTERMFEQLYRSARAIEAHPERSADMIVQLLRDLFNPLQISTSDKALQAPRIVDGGSTLLLAIQSWSQPGQSAPLSIVMRYAQQGQRLFHSDDAVLAGRIIDQLRRAVAFDKAVEQGRSEERMRLAQDLHDDIGARLLTLMYQASTPEMEAYVRHTLQDLKTLTRGLAVANQRLSHAAAEWKADLTQRLSAADLQLRWELNADDDVLLSVVQWSALTRVLRELVSNVMSHAKAQTVTIHIQLQKNRLHVLVSDDGTGTNPQTWSHGLGLGGVRKRVKQLGGSVQWRALDAGGVCCEVLVENFSSA